MSLVDRVLYFYTDCYSSATVIRKVPWYISLSTLCYSWSVQQLLPNVLCCKWIADYTSLFLPPSPLPQVVMEGRPEAVTYMCITLHSLPEPPRLERCLEGQPLAICVWLNLCGNHQPKRLIPKSLSFLLLRWIYIQCRQAYKLPSKISTRVVPPNSLALTLPVYSFSLPLYQPGSVDLTIDPENGNYFSEQVSVPSGRYEGQLVVGDSFIHPVKEFAVDSESGGIVVLELKRGTAIRYNYNSQNTLCAICESMYASHWYYSTSM